MFFFTMWKSALFGNDLHRMLIAESSKVVAYRVFGRIESCCVECPEGLWRAVGHRIAVQAGLLLTIRPQIARETSPVVA